MLAAYGTLGATRRCALRALRADTLAVSAPPSSRRGAEPRCGSGSGRAVRPHEAHNAAIAALTAYGGERGGAAVRVHVERTAAFAVALPSLAHADEACWG